MPFIPDPYTHDGAGNDGLVRRKVFRTHKGRHIGYHVLGAVHRGGRGNAGLRLFGGIVDGGALVLIDDLDGAAVRFCDSRHHLFKFSFDHFASFLGEGAHRAAHREHRRNDVGSAETAGVHRADGNDARVHGVELTGNQRLQRIDELSPDRNRIDAQMRPPAVAADALYRHPEGVGSGLERPYAEPEGAFVEQGFGVGTVDFLYVVLCENPGVNHGLRAFGDFFRGLKNPDDAAREVVVRPEVTKGTHQPRLMPVVTAGVRLPLMRALPRVRRGVGHWERIDVGS